MPYPDKGENPPIWSERIPFEAVTRRPQPTRRPIAPKSDYSDRGLRLQDQRKLSGGTSTSPMRPSTGSG